MVDIIEIYAHWYAGRSKGAVATSPGIDRKTVRNYLRPAEQARIVPGGPPMSQEDWSKLIRSWFPQLADRRLRQVRWGEIDERREFIKELLPTVTRATIRQRLRDERGLDISEPTFRRWLYATMPEQARSKVTVLRDEVDPGSEAQIDYGFLGQWTNPRTGKRHRIWAFVTVLPCSRHMFCDWCRSTRGHAPSHPASALKRHRVLASLFHEWWGGTGCWPFDAADTEPAVDHLALCRRL